jgi:hypothetical protein
MALLPKIAYPHVKRLKILKSCYKVFTMRNSFTKVAGLLALASASAMAAPVAVDLGDATTSVTNAGTALIGIAVLTLGIMLVIKFIRRG